MPRLLLSFAALVLTLARAAHGAELGVAPVTVQLDDRQNRATVQVRNHGSEPATVQADAIAWTRVGGVDRDAPSDALIVNPPVFTVPPGGMQLVRLGLRNPSASTQEVAYRLVLRELPMPAASPEAFNGQVRVLLALRVPVYVTPKQVVRDERWRFERADDGSLVAQVSNAGNVHLKVGALRLHGGASAPLAEQNAVAMVFPGETRRFALGPLAEPSPAAAWTLEVQTDRGPQHVAVDLAPR